MTTWHRRTAVLAAVAIVLPFAAVALKGIQPVSDAALFEHYGRAIVRGARLYGDVWDNKPPSIYLLNALLQALFPGRYAVHAFAFAAFVAVSVAAFASLLRRFGVAAWAPAALAFSVAISVLPPSFDTVENVALTFMLLGYAAWFAGRSPAAGIMVAVSATFWLPMLVGIVPLLLDTGCTPGASLARRRYVLAAAFCATFVAYACGMVVAFGGTTVAELVRSWGSYSVGIPSVAPCVLALALFAPRSATALVAVRPVVFGLVAAAFAVRTATWYAGAVRAGWAQARAVDVLGVRVRADGGTGCDHRR